MNKINVEMGAVPETMLQTMYARARESQKPDAVIHDEKAVEIVKMLDYDFSLADKDAPMSSGVMAKWVEDHPEYKDKTWDFNFDESRHKDGFYYHFTRCPMEKFARENGYLDVLPIGCNTDYLTCELNHGVLHRQSTLAEGGDICDYWIVGDKVKNPL